MGFNDLAPFYLLNFQHLANINLIHKSVGFNEIATGLRNRIEPQQHNAMRDALSAFLHNLATIVGAKEYSLKTIAPSDYGFDGLCLITKHYVISVWEKREAGFPMAISIHHQMPNFYYPQFQGGEFDFQHFFRLTEVQKLRRRAMVLNAKGTILNLLNRAWHLLNQPVHTSITH